MGLLKKLVPWVFAGIMYGTGWHLGADSMDTKWKQEVHHEYVKKTEARAATQVEVDKINQGYH